MTENFSDKTDEQLRYLFADENADMRIIRFCGDRGAAFGIRCLTEAAERGRMDLVKYLVEEKKALDFARFETECRHDTDENGTAPLIEAAQNGYAEIIAFLLEKYPFLKDIRDNEDALPIHHATEYNWSTRGRRYRRGPYADMVEAAPNYEECLRLLSDDWKSEYINAQSSDSSTPICFAAKHGNVSALRILLAHGADVNGGCYASDGTPILQGYDENKTIAALMEYDNNLTISAHMDNKGVNWLDTDEKGATLFHKFRPDTPELVDFYLKKLRTLDRNDRLSRTSEGTTFLHALVGAIANEDLDKDSKNKLRKFIPELIRNGVAVNAISWQDGWRSDFNGTAAHVAARNCDLDTLKILEKNGADLNLLDTRGNNLYFAVAQGCHNSRFSDGSLAMAKSFLDYLKENKSLKITIDQTNFDGKNILFELCDERCRPIFDYVLELAGEELKSRMLQAEGLLACALEEGNFALVTDLQKSGLVKKDLSPDTCSQLAYSVIRSAARRENPIPWNLLKAIGFDPNAILEDILTRLEQFPKPMDVVKKLVEDFEANIQFKDDANNGVFHFLGKADSFNREVAEYLYGKASEMLSTPDKDGQSAIYAAAKGGNLDFCKWCVEKDPDALFCSDKNDKSPFEYFLEEGGRYVAGNRFCEGIQFFYDEAHKGEGQLFEEFPPLCNYLHKVGENALPEVVTLLCDLYFQEQGQLDTPQFGCLPPSDTQCYNCSPDCLKAYLDACNRYRQEPDVAWTQLFDGALEVGNIPMVMFVLGNGYDIWEDHTLSDFWEKVVKAEDGNYSFVRMLFDQYKWPYSLLNVRSKSALYWLLKEGYSDEKLPLFKFLWKHTDDAGEDFELRFPNSGAAKTLAWLQVEKKQISLRDLDSPLAQSLLTEIQNPTEIQNWLKQFYNEENERKRYVEEAKMTAAACKNGNYGLLKWLMDQSEFSYTETEGIVKNTKSDECLYLMLKKCKKEFVEQHKQEWLQTAVNENQTSRALILIEIFNADPGKLEKAATSADVEKSTESARPGRAGRRRGMMARLASDAFRKYVEYKLGKKKAGPGRKTKK